MSSVSIVASQLEGTVPVSVTFTANWTFASAGPFTVEWDFGNGVTATTKGVAGNTDTQEVTYGLAGSFDVIATVSDASQDTQTAIIRFTAVITDVRNIASGTIKYFTSASPLGFYYASPTAPIPLPNNPPLGTTTSALLVSQVRDDHFAFVPVGSATSTPPTIPLVGAVGRPISTGYYYIFFRDVDDTQLFALDAITTSSGSSSFNVLQLRSFPYVVGAPAVWYWSGVLAGVTGGGGTISIAEEPSVGWVVDSNNYVQLSSPPAPNWTLESVALPQNNNTGQPSSLPNGTSLVYNSNQLIACVLIVLVNVIIVSALVYLAMSSLSIQSPMKPSAVVVDK